MWLKKILPHFCIIISLVLVTLYILDQFNPGMDLLGNDFIKAVLLVFCVATVATSVFLVAANRKNL